jgi:hypothetical protein
MLVACRLAGLSALEADYAGVRALARNSGGGRPIDREIRPHFGAAGAAGCFGRGRCDGQTERQAISEFARGALVEVERSTSTSPTASGNVGTPAPGFEMPRQIELERPTVATASAGAWCRWRAS